MGNAAEPRSLLVVRTHDVPWGMFAVRRVQHAIASAGIFVPAPERFQIHCAELPLPQWILDPRFKSSLLLLLSDFQPILNQDNPSIHDVLLSCRAEFQKGLVLLLGTETHHMFYAC